MPETTYRGLEVHLPGLEEVPGMLDRLAGASKKCHNYADDAFELSSLLTPGRGGREGLINRMLGTHSRVRDEATSYFRDVQSFATEKGDKVTESVKLYKTTDLEVAKALDQSLWSSDAQAVRNEAGQLGRSSALSPYRREAVSLEPEEPVSALKELADYRADFPIQPEWAGEHSSIVGKVRDTIWQVTHVAAELGLIERPYDLITELVIPFTGDWAALMACADALENLSTAAGRLNINAFWTIRRVDAVWMGIVADGCFVQLWRLHESLRDAPAVLDGYATAYRDVVVAVRDFERRAGEVLVELLDWAVITLAFLGPKLPGLAALAYRLALPPSGMLQTVARVYMLWDIVKLATEAIWDFEARVELGLLHGPNAIASMPSVPSSPSGAHYYD